MLFSNHRKGCLIISWYSTSAAPCSIPLHPIHPYTSTQPLPSHPYTLHTPYPHHLTTLMLVLYKHGSVQHPTTSHTHLHTPNPNTAPTPITYTPLPPSPNHSLVGTLQARLCAASHTSPYTHLYTPYTSTPTPNPLHPYTPLP